MFSLPFFKKPRIAQSNAEVSLDALIDQIRANYENLVGAELDDQPDLESIMNAVQPIFRRAILAKGWRLDPSRKRGLSGYGKSHQVHGGADASQEDLLYQEIFSGSEAGRIGYAATLAEKMSWPHRYIIDLVFNVVSDTAPHRARTIQYRRDISDLLHSRSQLWIITDYDYRTPQMYSVEGLPYPPTD